MQSRFWLPVKLLKNLSFILFTERVTVRTFRIIGILIEFDTSEAAAITRDYPVTERPLLNNLLYTHPHTHALNAHHTLHHTHSFNFIPLNPRSLSHSLTLSPTTPFLPLLSSYSLSLLLISFSFFSFFLLNYLLSLFNTFASNSINSLHPIVSGLFRRRG